jgi:hypothetical protein
MTYNTSYDMNATQVFVIQYYIGNNDKKKKVCTCSLQL